MMPPYIQRGDDLVTGSTKKSADNSPALMGRTFSVKTCKRNRKIRKSKQFVRQRIANYYSLRGSRHY